MISMSLHAVHRVVGERICGFSSEEIDKLVGAAELHDVSRYSCRYLLDHARLVLMTFGDKGLCYFVLHLYLDKFMNILYGRVQHRGELKALMDSVGVAQEVLRILESEMLDGFRDEVSVFKVLELVFGEPRARLEGLKQQLDGSFQEALLEHDMKEHFESLGYSKSTAKRKARYFIELLKDCLNTLECLGPSDAELLRKIMNIASEVRSKLVSNAKWILCTVVQHDSEYLSRGLGNAVNAVTQFCGKST
jgi:hypothetical protein